MCLVSWWMGGLLGRFLPGTATTFNGLFAGRVHVGYFAVACVVLVGNALAPRAVQRALALRCGFQRVEACGNVLSRALVQVGKLRAAGLDDFHTNDVIALAFAIEVRDQLTRGVQHFSTLFNSSVHGLGRGSGGSFSDLGLQRFHLSSSSSSGSSGGGFVLGGRQLRLAGSQFSLQLRNRLHHLFRRLIRHAVDSHSGHRGFLLRFGWIVCNGIRHFTQRAVTACFDNGYVVRAQRELFAVVALASGRNPRLEVVAAVVAVGQFLSALFVDVFNYGGIRHQNVAHHYNFVWVFWVRLNAHITIDVAGLVLAGVQRVQHHNRVVVGQRRARELGGSCAN